MDVKPVRRPQPSPAGGSGPEDDGGGAPRAGQERTLSSIFLRPETALVACLMLLPLLVVVFAGFRRSPLLGAGATVGGDLQLGKSEASGDNSSASSTNKQPAPVDKLLGGLLAPGFDEQSCLSRYQSAMYHRVSGHRPSPYLLEKLREYEARHKRCGPNTELYKKSVQQLKSNNHSEATECKYVIGIPRGGLGNMMLGLTSTFLYALLSNRVFLLHKTDILTDLFCEPFPEASWALPSDFPIPHVEGWDGKTHWSYGNMVKNKAIGKSPSTLPAYMYLFLGYDYNEFDRLFYCDEDQMLLGEIPWLVLKTDQYYVPGLFLMPTYEQELNQLFPKREAIFHHLGRYLFHPTNSVWGMITRYYKAYLAKADERLGIQIRIFWSAPISLENMLEQVLNCTRDERLLPDISPQEPLPSATTKPERLKAVLVTSLYAGYYEKIKTMYYEHPAATGEIISVHQPSHEEKQQTQKQTHNQKAWAEIYLLSFSDVLVTTGWSTFGYIAQGLGGLKPWILSSPVNGTVPNPTCRRAMTMEPCFHFPPNFDCRTKRYDFSGALVQHMMHCEDVGGGIKVID